MTEPHEKFQIWFSRLSKQAQVLCRLTWDGTGTPGVELECTVRPCVALLSSERVAQSYCDEVASELLAQVDIP
jgi:hypothetical protein